MSSLFAFSIASSLLLAVLSIAYKWICAGEKMPTANRVSLIGIYMASLLGWPVMHWYSSALSHSGGSPTVEILPDALEFSTMVDVDPGNRLSVMCILLGVYILGVAVMTVRALVGVCRICIALRRCRKVILDKGMEVWLTGDTSLAPCSIFGRIILSDDDLKDVRLITLHECAHINRLHSVDLLLGSLVLILQWYNPAAWMMLRELKSVHEFEADAAVLATGADMKTYQYLLIKKTVGERLPSPANSLNHSNLNKRITMMLKSNPQGWRRWRTLALAPALVAGLCVINLPAVAAMLTDASQSSLPEFSERKGNSKLPLLQIALPSEGGASIADRNATEEKIADTPQAEESTPDATKEKVVASETDNGKVYEEVDKRPEFPGGDQSLIRFIRDNLRYPEEAHKDSIQGKVIVRFTVLPSGKVADPTIVKSPDPLLSKAAIDVVEMLPDFAPGILDGKEVSVSFMLPVSFKLTNTQGQTAKSTEKGLDLSDYKGVTFMINGKVATQADVNALPPNSIQRVDVQKDAPGYPNGLVRITLK